MRTTNPLLLALVLAVAGIVVAARRTEAPWARAFKFYLFLGIAVIAIRVAFRIVLGGDDGSAEHVLFTMPRIPLPGFMSGVRLGGAVSAESVLAASYDGFRLATLLCCIGAANTLANPKRALRVLPAALYELGVTITVAVTVAPQLVESAQRVIRARKLRGDAARGRRAVRRIAMPVLHDTLDRSFQLAAAMDSRGYGRAGPVAPPRCSSRGSSGCAPASTDSSTRPPPGTSARRCWRRASRARSRGSPSAAAGFTAPATGPIRGGSPSGSPRARVSRPRSR
jgi:energy-coupling factor transport system permease protein